MVTLIKNIFSEFDARWCRCVFAAVVTVGLVWCVLTPPFQVADENFHFLRAYQVASGGLVPQRTGLEQLLQRQRTAYFSDETFIYRFRKVGPDSNPATVPPMILQGGLLPAGIPELSNYLIEQIPHDPDHKLSIRKLISVFRGEPFQGGLADTPAFISFPNTAAYSPIAYLPQAIGILVAKTLHLKLIFTFYAARIGALLFGAAAIALGVAILPWARAWFVFFAFIPMVTFQLASCSADSAVFAFSFLFAALALVLADQAKPGFGLLLFAGCVWALLFLCKTVYAGLALLLIPALWQQRRRLAQLPGILFFPFLLLSAIPGFFWARQALDAFVPPSHYILAEPHGQQAFILHNPLSFVTAMLRGAGSNAVMWFQQGTGVFGWLDTHSQPFFYWLCLAGLLVFVFADAPRKKNYLLLLCSLLTAVVMYLLVAFSISLIWNPVGVLMVNGIQGRYLLPLIPCLAIGLRLTNNWTLPFPASLTRKMLISSALLVQVVSMYTVMVRYWVW